MTAQSSTLAIITCQTALAGPTLQWVYLGHTAWTTKEAKNFLQVKTLFKEHAEGVHY